MTKPEIVLVHSPRVGPAPPGEGWFPEFVATLPVEDDRLPKRHECWGRDVLAGAPVDDA